MFQGVVVAPSGLGWVPGLIFSSLVALDLPWVLLASKALSTILHSVSMAVFGASHSMGVPGGVVASSGLGWALGSASWLLLGLCIFSKMGVVSLVVIGASPQFPV